MKPKGGGSISRNASGTVETLGSEEVAQGDLSKLPREGATSGTGTGKNTESNYGGKRAEANIRGDKEMRA